MSIRKCKIVVLLATVTAITLAGCGGSKADNYAASESAAASMKEARYDDSYYSDDLYEVAAEESYEESPAEYEMDELSDGEITQPADKSRKLIKNVDLSVETKEFDKLINTITSRIDALGGYAENISVNGSEYLDGYRNSRYACIIARIPASKLDSFVSTISENSNITNKNVSTTDVTLSYADTQARIASLRTEQERLNELIKEADTLEAIIALEERLTQVRYELESYESQLRTMDNQVTFSTVTISISEVVDYTEPEKTGFGERLADGFISGCAGAIVGLQEFLIAFVSIIPGFIVFLIIIGLIALVIYAIVRVIIKVSKKSAGKRSAKRVQKQVVRKNVVNTQTSSDKIEGNQPEKNEESESLTDK